MADDILSERKESKLINVCGLWRCTSMAGNPYLRGRMGNAVVLVMPNRYKTQDNQPDLIMYFAPPTPKERDDKKPEDADPFMGSTTAGGPAPAPGSIDDDVPF